MKLEIGNISFNTQKALKEYIRSVLRSLGHDAIVDANSPHFPFFAALTDRHPEADVKIGIGIRNFIVRESWGGSTSTVVFAFDIERTDGSRIDISFHTCVAGKSNSRKQDIRNVLRATIIPQTIAYRNEHFVSGMLCLLCGEPITHPKDAHVDHTDTPFKSIMDSFLSANPDFPLELAEESEKHHYVFKDEDIDYKTKWIDHHRSLAMYRILCYKCNVRGGKSWRGQ